MPFSKPAADSDDPSQQNRKGNLCRVGPILYFRGCEEGRLHLTALLVRPLEETPPVVIVERTPVAAEVLHRRQGLAVLRYLFSFPADTGGIYSVDDATFRVAGMGDGDLRLAYVSCNGQERGDRERSLAERNAMWQRLARQHDAEPFHLLLHGGDQLYADEVLDVHPDVQAWADGERLQAVAKPLLEEISERLRNFLLHAYVKLYGQPAPARLLARVPSLCMWDDHDICDGWGSLPAERLDAPIGRALFEAAREFFLLFQMGATTNAVPTICPDRTGNSLTWAAKLPGVLLVSPDLRSERRPQRIMGPDGWAAFEESLKSAEGRHVFLLSSVPVLGPRLAWVEAVMHWMPGAQKYEDDLRDQWQSRTHREEWRRMLRTLLAIHEREDAPVTILSGEIHLATRCTLASASGPIHQLIASGIAHPPPPGWYARGLGTLARVGEMPLPQHPIRLHPLPGRRSIYTSQRNYLMLQRRAGRWSAWWELEKDGPTPPLEL